MIGAVRSKIKRLNQLARLALYGGLVGVLAVLIAVAITSGNAKASLSDDLISFWNLEEDTGTTRNDSVGTNHLADVNSVTQIAGKVGNGASFASANTKRLAVASNPSVTMGDIDYSISAWFYVNSASGAQTIAGKDATSNRDYLLFTSGSSVRFTAFGNNSLSIGTAIATGTLSANTWYFVTAYHSATENKVGISLNGAAFNTTVTSGASGSHAGSDFSIGGTQIGSYLTGRVDSVGLWKKQLTLSEAQTLYNNGLGQSYPFNEVVAVAPTEPLSLSALPNTTGTAALTWSPPTNDGGATVTDYILEYKLTSDSSWSTFNDGVSSSTSAVVTGLSDGSAYDFRVSAINLAGTGPVSDTATTTPDVGNIIITTPKAYQVYQRDEANKGDIAISGTYTGNPATIEASWNGGAYETIVANPVGGTYNGSLVDVDADQGLLVVRFSDATTVSASKQYIGVGDVFIIAGQSNADGQGASNNSYNHPTLKAAMFGNDDQWKELVDPVDSSVNQVDAVSASSGGGSIWPLIATRFMASQYVPIAFVPVSRSGSAISQWARNSSSPGDTSTLYGSMYRRINAIGGAKAVLFWQGESDVANTTRVSYRTQLNNLVDSIYSDFGIPTMVGQIGEVSNQADGAKLDNIRLGQEDVWTSNQHAIQGPSLYDVTLTVDGLHFRTDSEILTATERWWAAMSESFYAQGDGYGPRLISTQHNADQTQVILTFSDETLPLLPIQSYEGITIKANEVAKTITSSTRLTAEKIKLTLSEPSSGTLTASISEGRTGTGAIVPTDSTAVRLPAQIVVNQSSSLLDMSTPVLNSVTSSELDGTYQAGSELSIVFNFSKAVTLASPATISLNSGGTCTIPANNNATTTYVCIYTVGPSDLSSGLDVSSIVGSFGDAAHNTLVNPVPVDNLTASHAIIIDTSTVADSEAPTSVGSEEPGQQNSKSLTPSSLTTIANPIISDLETEADPSPGKVVSSTSSPNTPDSGTSLQKSSDLSLYLIGITAIPVLISGYLLYRRYLSRF